MCALRFTSSGLPLTNNNAIGIEKRVITLITRKYTSSFSCPCEVHVGVTFPKSLTQSRPLHSPFSSVNFLPTSQCFLTFKPTRQLLHSAGFNISFPTPFHSSWPLWIPIPDTSIFKSLLMQIPFLFFPSSFPSLRPFNLLVVQSELPSVYFPCHSGFLVLDSFVLLVKFLSNPHVHAYSPGY